jgi:ABC-type uncharacterized transport system involved in gliding motility auxiliary subunit
MNNNWEKMYIFMALIWHYQLWNILFNLLFVFSKDAEELFKVTNQILWIIQLIDNLRNDKEKYKCTCIWFKNKQYYILKD